MKISNSNTHPDQLSPRLSLLQAGKTTVPETILMKIFAEAARVGKNFQTAAT
jgi:hypothetical protein